MGKALNFLQYHNAVPIVISLVLVGAGGAFAATDPQAIYAQQQKVVSIDNSFLLHTDLSTYKPFVVITGVTEDTDNYYVAYTLSTIDLQDNVWQPVQKTETMQVSKADLGPYRDLGVYVTQKLVDVVNRELDRLKQTQVDEAPTPSQEQVVTEYSGLVGKFLNPTTTTLPGYTPVVTPPPPASVASAAASTQNTAPTQQSGSSASGGLATIAILGNNPALVALHNSYIDLGAAITGPTFADQQLGIHLKFDGVSVSSVSLDTSVAGTHTVEYDVTNQYGTSSATRTIIVGDASTTSATSTQPTSNSGSSAPAQPSSTQTSPSSSAGTGSATPASGTSSPATSQSAPASTTPPASTSTTPTAPATTTSSTSSSTATSSQSTTATSTSSTASTSTPTTSVPSDASSTSATTPASSASSTPTTSASSTSAT